MDAYEAIIKNISRFVKLNEEETNYFKSQLRISRVKKKQFIVQPDFVCKYKTYIFQGSMRAYIVDINGQEHTLTLAIDDWWVSDYYSYIYRTPATQFVEAMEDSIVVQIEYHAEEELLERYPVFDKFFRTFSQRALANFQQRMLNNLSMTAGQRYDDYLKKHPEIVNRVPQYALASYLGMTTEFLSKIRSDKRKKTTSKK